MIVSRAKAESYLEKKLESLGGGRRSYYVLSADGSKNLGGPYTKEGANKRLRQVETFKRMGNPRTRDPVEAAAAARKIKMSMRRSDIFTAKKASEVTGLTHAEARAGIDWLRWHGYLLEIMKGQYRIPSRNPIEKNPSKPFFDREHNWKEVLIDKDGKKLTRKQILDHYKRNEKKIWRYLDGQTVMVILGIKRNQFIRRRHGPDGRFIKLTKLKGADDPQSFEYWILRRTIEFHPTLTSKTTPILWLDLDMHSTKNKEARKRLLGKMKRAVPQLKTAFRKMGVKSIHVYSSGATGGIHLEGDLSKPQSVDPLRRRFAKLLSEMFKDDDAFTIGIAKSGQIRLDTTTLHRLGSLRAPYSMTTAGSSKKPIRV